MSLSPLVSQLAKTLTELNNPIDWDSYFACLSLLVSSRSPCHRLHVGCVLVKDRRILATGYNGFLPGLPHQSVVRDNHEQGTVHAEQNAVSFAARNGVSLEGATAYVTHYTCLNCCKILLSSGIQEIRYLYSYRNDPLVADFCQASGVKVQCLTVDPPQTPGDTGPDPSESGHNRDTDTV